MAIIKRKLGNRKNIIIKKFREIRNDGLGGLAFEMFCEGWKAAWKERTLVNQERIEELELAKIIGIQACDLLKERIEGLEAELEKPPGDILICKCGWWGKMEDQDALGSKCGCCPVCGNEDLVWLSKLQERIKELEIRIKKLDLILETRLILLFCGRENDPPCKELSLIMAEKLENIAKEIKQALKGG